MDQEIDKETFEKDHYCYYNPVTNRLFVLFRGEAAKRHLGDLVSYVKRFHENTDIHLYISKNLDQQFHKELLGLKNLVSLSFTYENTPNKFIKKFFDMITPESRLQIVRFVGASYLKPFSHSLLPRLYVCPNITTLDLSNNHLNFNFKQICNFITVSKTLTSFYYDNNRITKANMILFCDALKKTKSLQRISLSRTIMNEGVEDLACVLSQIPTLRILDLSHLFEWTDYIFFFIQMLPKFTNLLSLDIGYNNMSDNAIKALCDYLSSTNTLIALSLLYCNMEKAYAKSFATTLIENRSLESLCIIGAFRGTKISTSLQKAIDSKPYLSTTNFEEKSFSVELDLPEISRYYWFNEKFEELEKRTQ